MFKVHCSGFNVEDLGFAVRTRTGASPHLLNLLKHQRPRVLRISLRLRCMPLCEPPSRLHAPHARCRGRLCHCVSPSGCVGPGMRHLSLPLSLSASPSLCRFGYPRRVNNVYHKVPLRRLLLDKEGLGFRVYGLWSRVWGLGLGA